MSRSADRLRRTRCADRDEGFALIEIMVALGIITIVMVALLPQLVVGIRSTGTSKLVTQAKGVAQGQLDRMRNMPYHIAPAAGEFIDVLDTYYRNRGGPTTTPVCTSGGVYQVPQSGWTGFVDVGGTRCGYEPSSGAFYRRVVASSVPGFSVVVDTQFLSDATPPTAVTPSTTYDSYAEDPDNTPTTPQIGVTVTVLYTNKGTLRPVSTYTQIADQPVPVDRIKLSATATALDVGSVTPSDGAISFSGGLMDLRGSLSYASTAVANLTGTSAALATGEKETGASAAVAAPPATTTSSKNGSPDALSGGCDVVCWGETELALPVTDAALGLPIVGSPITPMQSLLTSSDNEGVSFGKGDDGAHRAALALKGPLVQLTDSPTALPTGVTSSCRPSGSGTNAYLGSSGYLRSTAVDDSVAPSTVEACAISRSSTFWLFPTEFAPQGIVQIQLTEASARCTVTGTGHSATATYEYDATVKYHAADGSYQVAGQINKTISSDPLAAMNLNTIDVGGGHKLGDYISSWSGLLSSNVGPTQAGGVATVRLPGVVTLTSQPIRPGTDQLTAPDGTVLIPNVDLTSAVSVSLGAVGCSAQDAR